MTETLTPASTRSSEAIERIASAIGPDVADLDLEPPTIFAARFNGEIHWKSERDLKASLSESRVTSGGDTRDAVCVRLGVDRLGQIEVISTGTENEDQLAVLEEAIGALVAVHDGLAKMYGNSEARA